MLGCGLQRLVEQLQYELAFPPRCSYFWYVVVACHVAGLGQTLSLAQECGHEAAGSKRSEEAEPQRRNALRAAKREEGFFLFLSPEAVKPQQSSSCVLSKCTEGETRCSHLDEI